MLDPVIQFFTRVFEAIGRGIGIFISWLLWPFVAFGRWYQRRGWLIRGPVLVVILALLFGYGHFIWSAERWVNWNQDYVAAYDLASRTAGAGDELPAGSATQCAPSAIVEVTRDLIDYNVNQNAWIPSHPLSKAGFFGIPWKNTPFLDNKAAFQLGINQVIRRTTVELVDRLGRVRGTSQFNRSLQDAREAMAYIEDAWWLTFTPPFIQPTTQERQREAMRALTAFNEELGRCEANFDTRSDNLLQFMDRVTGDIGSTSDILRARMEASDLGWFDPRADDRFWFTYGQLYAYHGILSGDAVGFPRCVRGAAAEQRLGPYAGPAARLARHAPLHYLQRQ